MHQWFKRAALALALLVGADASVATAAETLRGRVVGVADGDTLTVLTPQRREVKVRLDEIDAPENGQDWGTRSQQNLSRMACGRTVQVDVSGQDRYGRSIGRVRSGGVDVNAAQVRQGAAWAYRDYQKDRQLLVLERDARAARRGLWAMPLDQITPPWEYRAERRQASAARATPRPTASCAKRTCTQMSSCAEARTQMKQCALPGLDSDGDGTPCESLCRG